MDRPQAIAAAALAATGLGALRRLVAVGGGDIAAAYRVETATRRAFLKIGAAAHPFDAEAAALAEIAATRTVRVPQVHGCGCANDAGYLLLEWIDLRGDGDWAAAAEQLAALHAVTRPRYGWPRANAIGASAQPNTPADDWVEFYRERRLRPQLALARAGGLLRLAAFEERACRSSDRLLADHAPPASVLHGDLWRGNIAFADDGAPVLFDPAAYWGDAETDLAMARLFGGFPAQFFRLYDAARPPAPAAERRRPLYQLYHVLNHANLFGGGYVAQAATLIERL